MFNGSVFNNLFEVSYLPLVLASLAGCQNQLPEKPNILFIAVDDLRPELGCYGNDHVKSPNIDQLAGEGVLFRNAFCQSAVCNPSRASLLTGLRPDATEVWDLKTNLRTTLPDVVTLPQYFKNNGYKTVCIGKIFHNIFPDSLSWSEPKIYVKGFPFDPDAGYFSDENLSYIEKRKASFIAAGNTRNLDRFGKWYIKASATECLNVPDNTYYDGAQTDIAVKKLEELKEYGKPFFFAVGYYRPHLPFNAPKKYWDLYQRDKIPLAKNPYIPENMPIMAINNLRELKGYTDFRTVRHPSKGSITEGEARLLKHGYYASVSYTDAQIGRLLDQLEKTKLINNTIVILWGDHGWKLGEHNSWAKMTNFEIDTHVPLIIKVPGMPENGKQCKALVEFVDIYPTLCELSGIPVPENLDGLSLKPLLLDVKKPWKTKVFSQFLREGIWKSPDGNPYMGYSIRTERFRYTEWYNWETKEFTANELYDHQSDQDENVNVAGHPEYNEIVRNLKRLIPCPWLQHDRFK